MFEDFDKIHKKINNYANDNGIVLTIDEAGIVTCTMKIEEKHLSSPNVCHGGVMAGFMDTVMGSAALSQVILSKFLVSTVEFKLNYFRPVYLNDDLIGKGKVIYHGKKLIYAEGEVYNAKTNHLLAKGLGTFNTYPLHRKEKTLKEKGIIDPS